MNRQLWTCVVACFVAAACDAQSWAQFVDVAAESGIHQAR